MSEIGIFRTYFLDKVLLLVKFVRYCYIEKEERIEKHSYHSCNKEI